MATHSDTTLAHISHEDLIEALVSIAPGLHGSGTFSPGALRALARYALSMGRIENSVETGSGVSTLLFSNVSERHVTFTVDSGTGSLENVRSSPFFRPEQVEVVEGPSQLTLPRYQFERRFQFALIDGPHGYPFPDLEYYYFYPHIEPGGILVVDDTQIPTIRNLMEFLKADDMWKFEEVVEATAFFRRTDAPVFCPLADGWWEQKYNTGGK